MNKSKLILFAFAVVVLIAADQVAKYLIRTSGGFYICNKHFAFGINLSVILVILFLILTGCLIFLKLKNLDIGKLFKNLKLKIKNLNLFFIFTMILIFAGSFSNIIDRIMSGCVTDYIDLKFWPVFNIADIYISAGAIMIMLNILRKTKNCHPRARLPARQENGDPV